MVDMEGISGIAQIEQVRPETESHQAACPILMNEINGVVHTLTELGVTEITGCDPHGGSENISLEQMDPHAIHEQPQNGIMMPSLDESQTG